MAELVPGEETPGALKWARWDEGSAPTSADQSESRDKAIFSVETSAHRVNHHTILFTRKLLRS